MNENPIFCGGKENMKSMKSKLFGDNKLNFYGWILGGLAIMLGSLYIARSALQENSIIAMLLAIYFVLIGIFGILLQNYHSRVSEKMDREKSIKTENS
jgi:type IV secretory pathway TrbL component